MTTPEADTVGGPVWTTSAKIVAAFAVGTLVGVLSIAKLVPAAQVSATASGPATSAATNPVGPGSPLVNKAGSAPVTPGSKAGVLNPASTSNHALPTGLQCDGSHNGGSTDRGVTANSIKLATTVVESGIGSAFQGEMRYGMEAVVRQVNSAGGVCGRTLHVSYQDDGWSGPVGAQYLRDFIHSGVFAIPVGASSEGLKVVIDSGDITSTQTPVVGTDGLEIDQYMTGQGGPQPWVWPVATATVSSARIMVDDAYRRGARHFAVVFDTNYHFGREAATAFNSEVNRLTGHNVSGYPSSSCTQLYCGIQSGQNSYSSQALTVKKGSADFIALFLEPETALTWMADANTPPASGGASPSYGYGAAQPLFTNQFESQCGDKCDQMVVWTGFKPVVEQYASDPSVRSYVSALQTVNPGADQYNQFTEGAYLGMELFVDALRQVGPGLTRNALKTALDGLKFQPGVTLQSALAYSPATRFANVTMQGFVMQYKGSAGGWRVGPTGTDPRPQAGAG